MLVRGVREHSADTKNIVQANALGSTTNELKSVSLGQTNTLDEAKVSRRRLVGLFKTIPLFSLLTGKDLEAIAKRGREVTFEAGQTIFKEGEVGVGFFLILDGQVEIRRKGKVLQSLGGARFFGEMSVIDDLPRTADAVAVKSTTCFALTVWEFGALVNTRPGIAFPIMKELVRRLRQQQASESDWAG
jgi:CRP-like cAMP-binding protein